MPKQKINQGPSLATGTLQQYSYLQIDQQICNAHYMEIVENA
ncbi:15434_t:CDS:2 [Cetraspora pellucida]|uniref:15434_t:CDS:1 n=1 Tax=Cetraspora pellucida TaxID=1433469 RepID=A0ACA9KEP6_9GLOM|nr:15434_t:CDS:2 [Cetraspora pellucida]